MDFENLPQHIIEEIKNRPYESELIKLAQRLLDKGEKENASKVLDLVLKS